MLALNPNGTGDGSGNPLDSFTPTNFQTTQNEDADIGSTAPAILPTSNYGNPNIVYPHIALQAGKTINGEPGARIYLLNLDNLSNSNPAGPRHLGGEITWSTGATYSFVAQGNQVLSAPAVWVNGNTTWAFIANDSGISAYQLAIDGNGKPSLVNKWSKNSAGASPVVVNGVLYYAGSNQIRALDPTTGNLLWSNNSIGSIHWSSPIVANGTLYIGDGGNGSTGKLTAYNLPANDITPTPMPTSTTTATPTSTPTSTSTPPPGTSISYPVPFLANAANGFSTFLSVQNLGSGPASVSIQYYGSDGSTLSTDADTALNSYTLWNPTQKLGVGQSGAAIITSNQPLNIVVAEATPYGGSAYVLPAKTSNNLISPLALNGAYGFSTQLTVFNSGPVSSNVTVRSSAPLPKLLLWPRIVWRSWTKLPCYRRSSTVGRR